MQIPTPSEESSYLMAIALKVFGVILSFLTGVVTATWIVASRVKGFNDRLSAVEAIQRECPGKSLVRIDEKLDRLHERIDDILLNGKK